MWILRKLLHPMDELAAIEFLLDKMKDTKSNGTSSRREALSRSPRLPARAFQQPGNARRGLKSRRRGATLVHDSRAPAQEVGKSQVVSPFTGVPVHPGGSLDGSTRRWVRTCGIESAAK